MERQNMECVDSRIVGIISLVFFVFATVSETQRENTALESTTFGCIFMSSDINASLVKESFDRTFSKLYCGGKCSSVAALSFYYKGDTSTCYCNNQNDDAAEQDDTNGSISYCAVSRTGNSSECQALYDMGFRSTKVYAIDPINTPIYCNLSALGWTVFQRRQDGSVNFNRNWTEYVNGFGDENDEFWMGLEAIHQKTVDECELHIYLEAEPNSTEQDRGYARYSNFRLGSENTFYTLMVEGFSGNVGDSLSYSNGMAFSTFNADHDILSNTFCSQEVNQSWWMRACFLSALNGAYLGGWNDMFDMGVIWGLPWGFEYSLRKTEMAFRCFDEQRV